MHTLGDPDVSRRFSPDRLRMVRDLAIRGAVAEPGPQAAWLEIEQSGDHLDLLQNVLIRVLHLDGDPIGFGVAHFGIQPRLTALYIHPDCQGRGYGRSILTSLYDDLMALGAATLATAAAAPAKPFYLALGFQESFSYSASRNDRDQGPRMCFHHMTALLPALGFPSTSRNLCNG